MPVRSQQNDKDPTSKGGGGGKITKADNLNLVLYVLLEPGFLTWERIFNNEKRLIKKCLSQNSRSLDQIMSCKHNALSTHLSGTAVWGINSHAVSVVQYSHTQTLIWHQQMVLKLYESLNCDYKVLIKTFTPIRSNKNYKPLTNNTMKIQMK